MSILKIHPNFKLQNHSFRDTVAFLSFIKEQFQTDYLFLKDLLSDLADIKVSTSGSTGKPKMINLSKQAMLNSAESTAEFFELPAKTTALHCLSSNYIAGKMMWVRAIHLGWHLEVVTPDSSPLLHTKTNFDFAAMVPLQAQNSLADLHFIKKLIVGGAPISYGLEQELKNIPTICYQTYGMTETITHIAVKKLSNSNAKEYFKSLPNVALSVDKRNCLLIDAPLLIDETVFTNDIVNLLSSTEFEWLGRFDNVINSGGIKLFPEQIEQKLSPYIDKTFLIGSAPDKSLGSKLILLIEAKETIDDLLVQLSKAPLSKYEMPKEILFLDRFMYSDNGKVLRKKTLDLIR